MKVKKRYYYMRKWIGNNGLGLAYLIGPDIVGLHKKREW